MIIACLLDMWCSRSRLFVHVLLQYAGARACAPAASGQRCRSLHLGRFQVMLMGVRVGFCGADIVRI